MASFADLNTRIEAARTKTSPASVSNGEIGQILKDMLQLLFDTSNSQKTASDISFQGSGLASGSTVQSAVTTFSNNVSSRLDQLAQGITNAVNKAKTDIATDIASGDSDLLAKLNALKSQLQQELSDEISEVNDSIDNVISDLSSSINSKESISSAQARYNDLTGRISNLIKGISVSRDANGTLQVGVIPQSGTTTYYPLAAVARYTSFSSNANIRSTNVQAAIEEIYAYLKSEIAKKIDAKLIPDEVLDFQDLLRNLVDGVEIVTKSDGRVFLEYTTVTDRDQFEIAPHAKYVKFDKTGTKLTSSNVQGAILELLQIASAIDNINTRLATFAVASDVQAEIARINTELGKKQDAATLSTLLASLRAARDECRAATTSANSSAQSASSAATAAGSAAADALRAYNSVIQLLDELDLPSLAEQSRLATSAAELAALEANQAAANANEAAEAAKSLEGRVEKNENDISDLSFKIEGKEEKEFISVEFKSGGYYNSVSNTDLTTGAGVYCEGIDISNFRGKTICFEFSGMVSNSSRKSLLADVNGNVLSYRNENSAHDEGNGRYLISFDIPSNAARLYISTKQHTEAEVYVAESRSGLNNKVNEIEKELAVIAPSVIEKKDIKNCTFEYGKISHVSGSNASNGDKKYIRTADFFFCLKGTTIAKNVSFPSNLRVYINVYSKADNNTFEEFIQNAQIGSVNSYTFSKECYIRLDAAYVGGAEFSSADDVKDWIDLTTKETSLEKIERISNKLENISNDVYDKGYPSYFQKPLEEVISLVREKNLLSGANGDSFIFATDLHFGNALGTSSLKNCGYTIQLASEIASKTNNKLFICGGDILTDDHTKEEALGIMRNFTNEAYKVFSQNYRFVSGNHDNNVLKTLGEENRISDDELYTLCHKCFEYNVVSKGNRYYYWDNMAQNIRYLVLAFNNITEKPIGRSQFDWLAETVLSAPTGCRIVVIAHGLIDKFSGDTPTMTSHGRYVMDLLTSYNSRGNFNSPLGGNFNFENAEGNVKLVIQGHTHIDKVVSDWSIPIVCTMNDSVPSSGGSRIGTYREVAIDCVDLDFTNNKSYFVRLGENNGQVREVTMA